jgi:hypothetical protein
MLVPERRCFLAPLCLLYYSENKTRLIKTGFKVFTAIVMKSSVFLDIMLCNPLKVNGGFGGTYPLHLHAGICLAYSSTLKMGETRSSERSVGSLRTAISQKIELFRKTLRGRNTSSLIVKADVIPTRYNRFTHTCLYQSQQTCRQTNLL